MARAKKKWNSKRIFRYWVEVRELSSGSVRKLPLSGVRVVCLKRGKKNDPPLPSKDLLQIEDDTEKWEVETFDELKARLREKYPDSAYERTLHYVRDPEAEERYERAMNGLMDLLVKQVADEIIEEQSRAHSGLPKKS